MNQTWITLSMDGVSESKDMALPNNIPLHDLLDLIFSLATGWLPMGIKKEEFNPFISSGDGNWQPISLDATLEELGILDGYCLNLERSHTYSTLSE
ncbi:hypothetical protein J2Z32_000033 [Paenibacillus turicensis]|uniref:Uncharacterized protein n=1 Tax=Paenibacillus turicensis TaxID=160487 RepID=A0ABS4FLM4_9BACL|nr:hypothetical protein [Paenibacillus turicensis]MBP1903421.1 hypothetical protein [Paenibacillus turicensis]